MRSAVRIGRFDVPVPGGALAAFRLGDAPPDAPVAVAVHGITSNSRAWLPLARALAGRVTLLAPDLRGRGQSNALPGPFGIRALADDVAALLDHLELVRPVLVGHSLGACTVTRLAADDPARVAAVVLVDGGLTFPQTGAEVDPQVLIDGVLGPALARLRMSFASREQYRAWWRSHPAFAGAAGREVADEDLFAHADHDLTGEEPELRCTVLEQAVRDALSELSEWGAPAHRLKTPATLLCAARGLLDEPQPMQPEQLARQWAAEAPQLRRVIVVPDSNHYTITLGERGAAAVADAIEDSIAQP
jgi:pimeloyl-ACP methyl ester carboxylesterase